MKKILCLLLAGLMIFALASCSGPGDKPAPQDTPQEPAPEEQESTDNPAEAPESPEPAAPQKIADDTTAVNMSFTPPEGYETVNRHFEYAADGAVVDKSFSYTFADDAEVIIGYTKGAQITDEIPQSYLDEAEVVDYGGKSFYIVTSGSTVMGVCQDEDVVYGIGWSFADEIDRAKFDALMNSISFTDHTETVTNGDDLFDIRYTLDDSLNVVSVNNNLTETREGEAVDKSISWYYGMDKDNLDFRLIIKVHKNSTVEDEKSGYGTPGEMELGGVTYTVLYENEDSEKPFAYYAQRGEDVYEIRNMGKGGSWSVTRTEESYAALEKLMSTVSFG